MSVDFPIFEQDQSGFIQIVVQPKWKKSFIEFVNRQFDNSAIPNNLLNVAVARELEKFSATLYYDLESAMPRIIFEDEEMATLFFLKFS